MNSTTSKSQTRSTPPPSSSPETMAKSGSCSSKTKLTTTPRKLSPLAERQPASAVAFATPFPAVPMFTKRCGSPVPPTLAPPMQKRSPANSHSVKSAKNQPTAILLTATKLVSPPERSPKFITPTTPPSAWKSERSSRPLHGRTSSAVVPLPETTFSSSEVALAVMASVVPLALQKNTPKTLSTTQQKSKKATLPPSAKSNASSVTQNSLPKSKSVTTSAQAESPSRLAKSQTASKSTSMPSLKNTTDSTAPNSPSPNHKSAWPSVLILRRSTISSPNPIKKISNVSTLPPSPTAAASACHGAEKSSSTSPANS